MGSLTAMFSRFSVQIGLLRRLSSHLIDTGDHPSHSGGPPDARDDAVMILGSHRNWKSWKMVMEKAWDINN